jgi:hypothetical protein
MTNCRQWKFLSGVSFTRVSNWSQYILASCWEWVQRRSLNSLTPAVCAVLLLISTFACAAGKPRLVVDFWAPGHVGCGTPDEVLHYVGGMYDIRVELLPDGKESGEVEYSGISDSTWPEGLVIEVGRLLSPADTFQSSASLRNRMQIEYYVTEMQARVDSLWRATGQEPPFGMTAPAYHFAFQVPPELADHYLCVSAEWDHPKYGHLRAGKPACLRILVPCSESAQHYVWSTQVVKAYDLKKYDKAIALADSFITTGWHDLNGLIWAEIAAQHARRYDDAIRLLDLCFAVNRTVSYSMVGREATASAPTETDRRLYEQARARIVELKSQQEQQQQQR